MDSANIDPSIQAKRDWIRRVLGVTFSDPVDEAPSVRERLNDIGLQVRQLGDTPEAVKIKQRFAEAVQALRAGQTGQSGTILDEIEPKIAAALSAARGADAKRVIGNAKAWRNAVDHVTAAFATFRSSVMASLQAEDEHDPEELATIADRLDTDIEAITGKLSTGLADQVDAVVNGDPARRADAVPKIKSRIDEIEKALSGDEGIAAIEDNGVHPIEIAKPAKAALDELRKVLDQALAA